MSDQKLIEQLPEMTLYEFVERVCGIELTVYQRKILETFANLPEDCCIVMGRKGPIILDGNGKRIDHVKQTYILR